MSAHRQTRLNQAGVLLALLALVLRMAVAALPMPGEMAGWTGVLDGAPICHAGNDDASGVHKPAGTPGAPSHDCALCPVCHLIGAPALPSVAAWVPVFRPFGTAALTPTLTAIAPPRHDRYAARPRGPPAFA